MSILIVDDFLQQRILLQHLLKKAGFGEIILAESARQALNLLNPTDLGNKAHVDLILMDLLMPEIDGIEACQMIKKRDHLKDIPIIIVTAESDMEMVELAFAAGAMDYIVKPVKKVDLLARVRSLLWLKKEMDMRKTRERELMDVTKQLEEANRMLKRLSLLDGLTDIANRRYFDEYLDREWRRAVRLSSPLSLLMIDIDFFKLYNDSYGHQAGDQCLKRVAELFSRTLKRGSDFAARYGGEEFGVILPGAVKEEAIFIGEYLRRKVLDLNIEHRSSSILNRVTISIGAATAVPKRGLDMNKLIAASDEALYQAKAEGRNQVRWRSI